MSAVATILIPIAPYHKAIASRAIDSAKRQTVPCEVLAIDDNSGSPALVRNMARQAHTPFVVWLDADDVLDIRFVERCVQKFKESADTSYIYTGWYANGHRIIPPDKCPFMGKSEPYFKDGHFHIVTTLFPTRYFPLVGGFNEELPGNEDTDFYMRCAKYSICGTLLPEALVHYSSDGQRSKNYLKHPRYWEIKQNIVDRNGGIMGCNCNGITGVKLNTGERQEGDVLAIAQWMGMRTEGSLVVGRTYRTGNFQPTWVHPADIKNRPDLWEEVPQPDKLTVNKEDVMKLAGLG